MNSMVVLMDESEARECVADIHNGLVNIRQRVVDLYNREGWRALGYTSWRHCVAAEFEQSQTHLYRVLNAGQIEAQVSPMGEIGKVPERQLRELAPLRDDPDTMRDVWHHVHEEHGENVTSADVRAAVKRRTAAPEQVSQRVMDAAGSSPEREHARDNRVWSDAIADTGNLINLHPEHYIPLLNDHTQYSTALHVERMEQWIARYRAATHERERTGIRLVREG